MADDSYPDESDEDDVPCARHPRRMTALRCASCETPICPDCAVVAAVGMKCPSCGRLPRAARAAVPTLGLVRASLVGVLCVAVGSVAFAAFARSVGFLLIIAALLIGIACGELVRRASGGYRDPMIRGIAIVVGGAAVALPTIVTLIDAPRAVSTTELVWSLIASAVSAYGAATRV